MKPLLWIAGGIVLGWAALALALQLVYRPAPPQFTLDRKAGKQLVVLVHGLAGREKVQPLFDLARETLPDADMLSVAYDSRPLSNTDVYELSDLLESQIHAAHSSAAYESIVIVGHSMGAMICRKVLLWGHGREEDRGAPKGKRAWVDRVNRFVSLAGINRGWSIEPRPENMSYGRYALFGLGERVARLTGSGGMVLAMQRGSPFIADSRVQWIRLTRGPAPDGAPRTLPQVIHFLGSRDDIVSRADALDLGVARDTVFVTLAGTGHADIAAALEVSTNPVVTQRREAIRHALSGEVAKLSPDRMQELAEDSSVRRVVYVMHGIRDYGDWTDRIRAAIEARHVPGAPRDVAVVNKKYGYFPMLPFLLYWDRQKNVRRFMDEYTENLALYPNGLRVDFAGHSNGTYILASAMQHYRTISVGRIFFAGSVVPKHYPWRTLIDQKRVERVVNVAAGGDWVVAFFPKLFEQVADWVNVQPATGVLDVGSAGFRGFQAAGDPRGNVRNVQYVHGGHGAGVETAAQPKLDAIVSYLLEGDEKQLSVFENAGTPEGWLDVLSNVSWIVWIILAAVLLLLGRMAFRWRRAAGVAYVILILGILTSF